MDRNNKISAVSITRERSLSARRAWIEIYKYSIPYVYILSLSARRAWIEIAMTSQISVSTVVALRKESVDRNRSSIKRAIARIKVALRKESVDRNHAVQVIVIVMDSRSPQGERG